MPPKEGEKTTTPPLTNPVAQPITNIPTGAGNFSSLTQGGTPSLASSASSSSSSSGAKETVESKVDSRIAGRNIPASTRAVLLALNGDLYVPNDEGEQDIGNTKNYVTIPKEFPDIIDIGHIEQIAAEVHDQDPSLDPKMKNLILACRLGAWRLGLLKPKDAPSSHNCRYNESSMGIYVKQTGNDISWVSDDILKEVMPAVSNIFCLVAYIFRWKGHHYKSEFDSVYSAKWAKCRNVRDDLIPAAAWEHIAVRGCHAVYPDVLDNFWADCMNNGLCARPLSIRYTVPAAGTASFFSMYAGLHEFRQLFPNQAEKMVKLIEKLENVVDDLRINRWKGGINRKFYNAPILLARESDFSALAAAIKGLNTPDGAATDLGSSESLTRVSKSAALSTKIWRSVANGVIRAAESSAIQKQLGISAVSSIVFAGNPMIEFGQKPKVIETR